MASKVPAVTLTLLVVNCTVHVVIFLFSLNLNHFAISYKLVMRGGEYYRILSAAFVHGGILHIFMNMSSLLQLGMTLEVQFGSLQFLLLSLWSVVLVGVLYLALSWASSFVLGPGQLGSSAVGYSGVLFCYAVIEANHTTEASRSIFGMFNVPAKLMPFVLLVLLQVLIPNISMLGHLAGVIVGLAAVGGGLNVFMPSEAFMEAVEAAPGVAAAVHRLPAYFRCTGKPLAVGGGSGSSSSGGGGGCGTVLAGITYVLQQVWNVVATLLHIVGFPTDAVCARLSRCGASVASSPVGHCATYCLQCLRSAPSSPSSSSSSSSASDTAAAGGGASDDVELSGTLPPPGNSAFRALRGAIHTGPPPAPGGSGGGSGGGGSGGGGSSGSSGGVYVPLNQNVTEV